MPWKARVYRGKQTKQARFLFNGPFENQIRQSSFHALFGARRGRYFLELVDENGQLMPIQSLAYNYYLIKYLYLQLLNYFFNEAGQDGKIIFCWLLGRIVRKCLSIIVSTLTLIFLYLPGKLLYIGFYFGFYFLKHQLMIVLALSHA